MNVQEAHAIVVWLNRAGLLWAAEGQAEVWADALSDVDGQTGLQAAREIARNHTSDKRAVVPGDIRALVSTIRRQRLQGAPSPNPPDELADDPKKFQRWIKLRQWAIGNGMDYEAADVYADQQSGVERSVLPAVPRPPELSQTVFKRP